MKKYLLIAFKFSFLGIGILFIWLFLRNLTAVQKQDIWDAFKIADYSWIIIAIILGLISHWIRALRWKMLIEPMGYKPHILNVYMAVMIGYLANMALPRMGEVSRCGILTKYEKIPFNESFGSVITERAIDMISFVLLFFFLVMTQSARLSVYIHEKVYEPLLDKMNLEYLPQSNVMLSIAIVAVAFLAILLYFRKRIKTTKIYLKVNGLLAGFIVGIKSLSRVKNPFKFILYTALIWVLYLLMAYLVFFSLKETSVLKLDAGIAVLVFGSIGIMIVQGGIGIYPAIVAETLVLFSITSTTGYAMGWLIWSSQSIMVLFAGVFSLLLLNTFNSKGNDKIRTDKSENPDTTNTHQLGKPVQL